MRLLDLFCGAGGAAMGYHRAGFDEIVGVDIESQPRYPFEFTQGDALEFAARYGGEFDLIHASPPCQAYSDLKALHPDYEYPELIEPIRQILSSIGKPYIIENVEGAPLNNPITLCGSMFGLRVIRHRLFECNPVIWFPPGPCQHGLCYTLDKRKNHYGKLDEMTAFVTVTGGGNCSKLAASDAMGINWMVIKGELNEAIPPAYTEWLGSQILRRLAR